MVGFRDMRRMERMGSLSRRAKHKTRRKLFLERMEDAAPWIRDLDSVLLVGWDKLVAAIEPYCPSWEGESPLPVGDDAASALRPTLL